MIIHNAIMHGNVFCETVNTGVRESRCASRTASPSAQVENELVSNQGFEVRTATTSMRQSYGIQPQLS